MLFIPLQLSTTLLFTFFTTLGTPSASHPQQVIIAQVTTSSTSKGDKVHGQNLARYCSDPSTDIYKISNLAFYPTNPTIGYYLIIKFFGLFSEATGDIPWLNVTGTFPSDTTPRELHSQPLCDIKVFQEISLPNQPEPYSHRSCPPGINEGYAVISSPPIPLLPEYGFETGKYEIRAEAVTQDSRSIFCVEGVFDVV